MSKTTLSTRINHKSLVAKSMMAGLALGITSVASANDLSEVPSGMYKVDPTHAYITFSYNHLGLSNPVLAFDDFDIDLNLDNADPTKSTVNVSIDVNSVVTGSDIWKDHITGGKWFDTANHPEITFASTKVEAGRDGNYTVTGDLTVKGESKPVQMVVTINGAMNHPMSGTPTIGMEAEGELLRSEFGLGANTPFISDEVSLAVTAELGLAN